MCGVFGIYDHPEAANLTYLGLHALQHRGQESGGVVSNDDATLHGMRAMGHVRKIFTREVLAQLPGRIAIGHVRYTTAGGSLARNIQPLLVQYRGRSIAIGHNGNLVNEQQLREELERQGAIFATLSDTEVMLQLMARSEAPAIEDQLVEALGRVQGAYSLVLTTEDKLVAVRDPHGFRPLVLGRLRSHPDAWVVASETCAFDLIEAEYVRDLAPGEILVIDREGQRSVQLPAAPRKFCVFEHVYFARPDSVLDGVSVYEARIAMGAALAAEHPVAADIVVPVPDSGVVAALGYARASGLPFEMGLIRNHYVGRTFIEPTDSIRHFGVRLKLNAVPQLVAGKRVVIVDDSIVRGTTSRKIVQLLRNAGAREVHVRVSSPPIDGPCHYGIDTPTRAELVASEQSVAEIARTIEADSLGYLSPEGLRRAVRQQAGFGYCDACFTGDYPVRPARPGAPRALRVVEV
ncbi:MAG: amidophosphoribosyltransferase [Deltaproteobacteria bacterium]|nr:amidophosphoribosyltransferase [Deltaproteobacteria bacterium]MBK8237483.1 amidophosphoribosyltransferase [Deltaproteobacteria bacterium]MBK8719926.1 amidophosphoribosyltransferase [Deltaproteobacteria bacterium]MBP7291403.1 amidophosphoribosyltransferase [Nannocystaceae bacterium]